MRLVDERCPGDQGPIVCIDKTKKRHVRIGDGSANLHRRAPDKSVVLNYPFMSVPLVLNFLSFSVQEDTSLTIFGLFSYDYASDTFQATELSTMFAGGLVEAKRILSEKIQWSQSWKNTLLSVTLLCAGICLFTTFVGV